MSAATRWSFMAQSYRIMSYPPVHSLCPRRYGPLVEGEGDARTQTRMRELRQAAPARIQRGAHLQLRMHVLQRLRARCPGRRLPELWRQLRRAADPAGAQLEGRQLPGQVPA